MPILGYDMSHDFGGLRAVQVRPGDRTVRSGVDRAEWCGKDHDLQPLTAYTYPRKGKSCWMAKNHGLPTTGSPPWASAGPFRTSSCGDT